MSQQQQTLRLNPHQPGGSVQSASSLFDSVQPDVNLLSQLVEMGFPPERARMALQAVHNKHLAAAMDWLLEHPQQEEEQRLSSAPASTTTNSTPTTATATTTSTTPSPAFAVTSHNSHAVTTKEEQERRDREERQRAKELEAAKLEKQRALAEKERIRQRIAEMKKERQQKYNRRSASETNNDTSSSSMAPSSTTTSSTTTTTSATRASGPALIQIRLPSGEALRHTFQAEDSLACVQSLVCERLGKDATEFTLLQPVPRKEFTQEMMNMTLAEAELAPRGALTVMNVESRGVVRGADEDTVDYTRPRWYHRRGFGPMESEDSEYTSSDDEDYEDDEEEMSYERLLELQERIGNVATGATQEQIDRIPLSQMSYSNKAPPQGRAREEEEKHWCPVCQAPVEEGEWARTLLCGHAFHQQCIDRWLSCKKTCPTCTQRIDAIQA
ncbi:RING-type domain-containing protein [Balamuthia mandrillaris]